MTEVNESLFSKEELSWGYTIMCCRDGPPSLNYGLDGAVRDLCHEGLSDSNIRELIEDEIFTVPGSCCSTFWLVKKKYVWQPFFKEK